MDVSCPQCDTLYELDHRRVRGGVALKCSQCEHVFRYDPEGGGDESQRRWMVRQQGTGDVLYFGGFDALHRWIMEGTVAAEDEISRTGEKWTALREVGEFSPIFQVLDSIAELTGSVPGRESQSAGRRQTREVEAVRKPSRVKHPTSPGLPGGRRGPPSEEGGEAPAKTRTAPGIGPRSSEPDPSATEPPVRESEAVVEREARVEAPSSVPSPGTSPVAPARPSPAPRSSALPSPPAPAQAPEPFKEVRMMEGTPLSAPTEDEEWSLGQLAMDEEEYPRPDGLRQKQKRGGGGWFVAVLLVVVLMVVGIWQWEALEALLPKGAGVEATAISVGGEVTVVPTGEDVVEVARGVLAEAVIFGEREAVAPLLDEALGGARVVVGEAVEEGERASRRAARPSVPELLNAGRRALDRSDGAGALRRYQAVLEEDSENIEATIGLGWAYLAMGDIDSAVIRFRSALRRSPSAGEALIGIGRAERDRGNLRGALSAYEDYLQRFPGGSHATIADFQSRQLRESLGQ